MSLAEAEESESRSVLLNPQSPFSSGSTARHGNINDDFQSGADSRPIQKLVVAMVCDAVLPYHHGGREHRYQELMRRLVDRADIHMYTMQWWSGPRIRRENGITFYAISPLIPMYNKQRRSLRQALVFGISCMRLLRQEFDVLEADSIPFIQVFILRLVTWLKRRRFVVTWHEVWGIKYWRQYLGILGILAWMVEELAMKLPDHILAASPQTAERLRASLGDRSNISLAIHGIDLDKVITVMPASQRSDITVVGRLMEHKKVDLLLDAVALLHGEGQPVTCRVIGDGPERGNLHQRAVSLGIRESVEFLHDVREQKDVYALLKASRVCVFPSEREGFGVAPVEAMACGIPVITTSAPDNLSQYVVARSGHGLICEPTVVEVAKAIRTVLGERGADEGPFEPESWLREYSWDAIASQVSEALRI
jgi:glycosyltransferase involved in cell wall biosynthesis